MNRSVLFVGAAVLAAFASTIGQAAAGNGATLLPTGQRLTPTAASGAIFQSLNPDWKDARDFRAGMAVTTVVSHDQKTLLILTSGFNEMADASGTKPLHLSEYIFVYDISSRTPRKRQVLTVPNSFSGIVFAPDDRHFYVSGGADDDIHVFARKAGHWQEAGPPIALGHLMTNAVPQNPGDRFKPVAAGLDVTADGRLLVVANYNNDSISIVNVATRQKIGELDLRPGKENPRMHGMPGGEYPLWVQIRGRTAYVSAQRDREVDVVDIAGAPRLITRIKVQGVPNRMLLNRTRTLLYVTSDNADIVSVIDTLRNRVIGTINAEAPRGLIAGRSHFGGAAPNSLALSPHGHQLFVTDGGLNAVAIIRLNAKGLGQVSGLVPTGWYPNSVSTAGGMLYVVNGRSDPGPNPQGCTHNNYVPMKAFLCRGKGHYILQLSHAGFLTLPIPGRRDLGQLTDTVAANDDLGFRSNPADDRLMAALREHIKHVIYIIKENRTYDQILGDLGRGNSDPALTLFGQRVTPNQHALARQFVDLDNFEDSGEVSGEGWPWSTDARETDVGVKEIPVQYAGRISNYDVEGQNRNVNVGVASLWQRRTFNPATPNDPDLLPGTGDVASPDGNEGQIGKGHLWDAALRAHVSLRNYGFHLDLFRYASKKYPVALERNPYAHHLRVAFPSESSLQTCTDPYFRGFDTRFPDFWREREWAREFDSYVAHHNLPQLELVRLMEDHMGSFQQAIDGVNTPAREVADNDYAVGKLIAKVAHSPYAGSTLIFIVEDDAQDGPDHVDAHRSTAFVVGPYVKQGKVVSQRYTTVNMLRTIEDLLGIKPMSVFDAHQRPMSAVFDLNQKHWSFAAAPSALLYRTSLPVPRPRHPKQARRGPNAAWWASRTEGYDWLQADKINAMAFNHLLWQAYAPGRPYPTERSGKDLRQAAENRGN